MHARMFREFYLGDRVLVKDLRKEDIWWPGSVAERSGPRTYVVVLNDGRVWITCEGTVWTEQCQTLAVKWNLRTNPPIVNLLFHLACMCVPDPAPAPSVTPANAFSERGSGQRQAQEEVPATAVDKALPIVTQSPEAARFPFRLSSRVRKAPDRLIETI